MRTSATALTTALLAILGPAVIAVNAATPPTLSPDNPFAAASTLPYGLPPFDRIRDGDFMPAYQAGMAEQLAEVAAIVANPDPPTFENTVLTLERSGRLLDRVTKAFVNLNASNGDDAMRQLETELAPLLAAHHDAIHLDPKLFARLDAMYQERAHLLLDAESFQLLLRQHKEMVLAGAKLPEPAKVRLRAYNAEISTLMAQFRQRLLQASADGGVTVDQAADLEGLTAAEISAAADAAGARGLKGKWLLVLVNTTTQPMLAELRNRALRERLYRAAVNRGVGGKDDTTAIVVRLVKLRAERARLLGYPNHAASVLDDETAGTPARADAMMRQLAPAARAGAEREAATIQKLIDSQAPGGHAGALLQPWDWDFYSGQVRKARYDFDEAQIRPYFELNRVLQDGVFYAAHELYGLSFRERTDLPVYGPDIRVFEVFDEGEKPLGLYIADLFARDNKQGGAWMDNYVDQSHFFGQQPVIVNNLNIPKPPAGEPVLLSFDDVRGLFHEFGHAMHGMLSDVKYQSLSGTRTPRDFVEYPSQYNEMWAREPAVLAHYARHYQTGEPMPADLLQKMIAAQNFNQGYGYTERLAAAVIDLALHEVSAAQAPAAKDLPAFEQAALRKSGLALRSVPPRYHANYFRHVFGDDYSAGYYAYTWSEVLARDTGEWMHRHGGLTRENGAVLRAKILSRGRTQEPSELFRAFYGKDPEVAPLLEYYGLSLPAH
ncbi:MAG TPA: M3 family metallopeptidase [Steroidobacteraceae bacterium]|nr:M3 family metallopeptidase [Steroidobacteraceae bacterium]